MFRSFFGRRKEPLTGAPATQRLKTYSAQSGFVYQYFYEGHRPISGSGSPGIAFVFRVSADRKHWGFVDVLVPDAALASWERTHGRRLSSTERYAIAKLSLFQAFDERTSPGQMDKPVRVPETGVEAIVETLGL